MGIPLGGEHLPLHHPQATISAEQDTNDHVDDGSCLRRGYRRDNRGVDAIKWPNDLLIGEKKIGGILTEADMEMDRINFVIVGIGINVNMSGNAFPPSIRDTATSLQEALGRRVSRVPIIQALLRKFELWYTRFKEGRGDEIKGRWEELSQIKGKEVSVDFMGETVKGQALEIDGDGALLVQEAGGEVKRIVAGDVHVRG